MKRSELHLYVLAIALTMGLFFESCLTDSLLGSSKKLQLPRVPQEKLQEQSTTDPEKVLPEGIFVLPSGKTVQFYQIEGKWKADVNESSDPFSRTLTLPVHGNLSQFSTSLQAKDIHITSLKDGKQGFIYLGAQGLLGGMKRSGKKKKTQSSKEEKQLKLRESDKSASSEEETDKSVSSELSEEEVKIRTRRISRGRRQNQVTTSKAIKEEHKASKELRKGKTEVHRGRSRSISKVSKENPAIRSKSKVTKKEAQETLKGAHEDEVRRGRSKSISKPEEKDPPTTSTNRYELQEDEDGSGKDEESASITTNPHQRRTRSQSRSGKPLPFPSLISTEGKLGKEVENLLPSGVTRVGKISNNLIEPKPVVAALEDFIIRGIVKLRKEIKALDGYQLEYSAGDEAAITELRQLGNKKLVVQGSTDNNMHAEMDALKKAYENDLIKINEEGTIGWIVGSKEIILTTYGKKDEKLKKHHPMDNCGYCTLFLHLLGLTPPNPTGRPSIHAGADTKTSEDALRYPLPDFILYNRNVLERLLKKGNEGKDLPEDVVNHLDRTFTVKENNSGLDRSQKSLIEKIWATAENKLTKK